jgi:MFS family permease
LYFALASFSQLFVNKYQESISISGLHYIALAIGEIAGTLLCGPLMDRMYQILTSRAGKSSPELRIPFLIPSILLTPAGFLLYGWAAEYQLTWIAVDLGGAILTMGMQVFSTTLSAYVMDAYPAEYISSASAATQLLSSLLAFAFPLFADRLYAALGYGWGNTLLAFLSVSIALPATCVLWKYGERLRAMKDWRH